LAAEAITVFVVPIPPIHDSEFEATNTFRFNIPKTLKGVDSTILNPRNAWADKDAYLVQRDHLASLFIKNFHKYSDGQSEFDYSAAGPQLPTE
jgi:phosphoenolpyruvate carboxykinase (ATP)